MKSITILLCSLVLIACMNACHGSQKSDLVNAASAGNLKEVVRLINEGIPVDSRANDDWTPLTIAAREGHVSVVEYLLAQKAQINKPEGGGNTPLFWAAYNGNLAIVKLLISKGATPSIKCEKCISPLDIAISRGHHDVADYLKSIDNHKSLK